MKLYNNGSVPQEKYRAIIAHSLCSLSEFDGNDRVQVAYQTTDTETMTKSDVDILFEPDMSQQFSLFTLGGMYMDLIPPKVVEFDY